MFGTVVLTVEGGAEIELPLAEFLDVSYNLVPVFPPADTKEEARALFPVPEAEMRQIGLEVCAFYRDPTGVILPTVLNDQTLPRVMPTFRRALEAARAGATATAETATDLLLWYIGARNPLRIKEPRSTVRIKAPPTVVPALDRLSALQRVVATEAQTILGSKELAVLRAAHAAGTEAEVVVAGRTIVYSPELNASGMTLFGENGFVLGTEAFKSQAELTKTLLHELHRLATTASQAEGVGGALAAGETAAAFDFAETLYALGLKVGLW